jgi:hypothetical protein
MAPALGTVKMRWNSWIKSAHLVGIDRKVLAQLWSLVFGLMYIMARLCLLVETFRTFVYLPLMLL